MHIENEIKRRPDGSIDTGFYMQIGRDMRSAKAHELAHQMVKRNRPDRFVKFKRLLSPMRPANG